MPTRPSRPLLAMLVLAACCAARAQTSPYYIGASVAATHDSNVLRLASRVGDTYYSVGVLGGLDQPIGRQRVYASGTIRNNRFQTQKQLDNTSYGLNAGVDWATIEKLSGTLNYSANSSLINYGGTNTNQSSARNIERSNQALASVQYGMASLLSVQASLTHRSLSYSDPIYRSNDLTQTAGSAGISWRPSGGLTLGAALRATRGEYANSTDRFNRRDLDLTALWVPTGLSTLNSRVSLSRQTADGGNSSRDFSGATGFLSWAYQPTGKLQFNTWVSRDTGAESSFFNPSVNRPAGSGDSSQVTNTLAVDASYAATGKIRVNAGVRTSHRSLVLGALDGSDTINGVSLGATYQALRNLQVTCNLGQERRSASGPLSSDYTSKSLGCAGQITLQ